MSFSEVKAAAKPGRISVSCNRVGGSVGLRLLLSIGGIVVDELGLKAGDRFRMFCGHNEHARMIRIELDAEGPFRLVRGSRKTLRAVMHCPEVLPDGPRKPRPATFRKDEDEDGKFDIDMPEWFGQGGCHAAEDRSAVG
jgi:hypothetical protein